MEDSISDRLYHDPELASLYDLDNDWGDDLEYCRKLAETAGSVLDLGCGTGRLISTLAGARRAVGVDPADAMLAIARQRSGAEKASWHRGDARTVRLGETFDLVVMTGHAFQTLLTPEDQLATLRSIAAHLAPGGRFILDTRNPARQEWREWTPEQSLRTVQHPGLGLLDAWNDVHQDAESGIVTYETHYRAQATGRMLSATRSRLRFSEKPELERLIAQAGLAVDHWLGDWQASPWTPHSPEIIPLGRRA
jgi:SAM-dependent methyltransferase